MRLPSFIRSYLHALICYLSRCSLPLHPMNADLPGTGSHASCTRPTNFQANKRKHRLTGPSGVPLRFGHAARCHYRVGRSVTKEAARGILDAVHLCISDCLVAIRNSTKTRSPEHQRIRLEPWDSSLVACAAVASRNPWQLQCWKLHLPRHVPASVMAVVSVCMMRDLPQRVGPIRRSSMSSLWPTPCRLNNCGLQA